MLMFISAFLHFIMSFYLYWCHAITTRMAASGFCILWSDGVGRAKQDISTCFKAMAAYCLVTKSGNPLYNKTVQHACVLCSSIILSGEHG